MNLVRDLILTKEDLFIFHKILFSIYRIFCERGHVKRMTRLNRILYFLNTTQLNMQKKIQEKCFWEHTLFPFLEEEALIISFLQTKTKKYVNIS